MKEVHLVYYSPALSTRKIMRSIGKEFNTTIEEHDITQGIITPLSFTKDDIVIFGVPVYSGRVPAMAMDYLQQIKGDSTPSILVCVYGNREYEDALLELKNTCQVNGFIPFTAGTFIARHSIFSNVAKDRPDEKDKLKIADFVKKSIKKYQSLNSNSASLEVKGNYPYREVSKIPLTPKGDKQCDNCGTCVKMCPTHAISEDNPKKTNKDLCISCARCIVVCPQHSRKFRGLIYSIARRKFESKLAGIRKDPEFFFIV